MHFDSSYICPNVHFSVIFNCQFWFNDIKCVVRSCYALSVACACNPKIRKVMKLNWVCWCDVCCNTLTLKEAACWTWHDVLLNHFPYEYYNGTKDFKIEWKEIILRNDYYYYYWYSDLGPVWAETRVQSGNWYGSGTLHPGQVLRGSLPLLSSTF